MMKLRKQVIDLAISIALRESENTGKKYTACISKALDESCRILGVNRKQFIKMFI
ncbi:hypothetical protein [Clostridium senegalense]